MLESIAKVPKILGITRHKPIHGDVRLGVPLRAVHNAGLAITTVMGFVEMVLHGPEGRRMMNEAAFNSDLVIFQTPHNKHSLTWIESLQACGVKVAIEYDDHPFWVDPTNDAYRTWGVTEKDDWKDCGHCVKCQAYDEGRGPRPEHFNIKMNKAAKRRWLSCVQAADAVITTTPRLAKVFRHFKTWRYDKPIHVIPNMLEMSDWARPSRIIRPEMVGRTIRIGWHGGVSHRVDLNYVKPAIIRILKDYPQVKISLFGYCPPEFVEGIPDNQFEYQDWKNSKSGFLTTLKTMGIDIGIVPVVPTRFARTKSELKWVEYASQGIPVVATACEPYSDNINFKPGDDPNWTGLLALSTEEWYAALSFLIENEAARNGIGQNAYDLVVERYDAPKRAAEIMAVYQRILDGNVPLNAAERREMARAHVSVNGSAD